MSAAIEAAQAEIRDPSVRRGHPTGVGVILVVVAATLVVGLAALTTTSASTGVCLPRVGCEQGFNDSGSLRPGSIGTSFAAVGVDGASAVWFEAMIEPASPAMEHFLHPAATSSSFAFEPTSPAMEHFLHPGQEAGAWPASAFEPVSPALEHFLHASLAA